MYERGRITGRGAKINDTMEITKRIMYYNGERLSWTYTQPKGTGDPPPCTITGRIVATWCSGNTMTLGWDKLFKVCIYGQWIKYVKQHI
jgi:hypothetical protein